MCEDSRMDLGAIAWEVAPNLVIATRRLTPDELRDVIEADALIAATDWAVCMNEVSTFVKVPIEDGPVPNDPTWTLRVRSAAYLGFEMWNAGLRVCCQCGGGFNRSGLIAARILMFAGRGAMAAVRDVRAARGPEALDNPYFVEWLRREEVEDD